MKDFLLFVQNRGLKIETVFDIGAYDGSWSKDIKSKVLPNAEFILFEANIEHKNILEHSGNKSFCGMALSNPEKKFVQFYNKTSTGDSYYKENTKFYDYQKSILLPCVTLDKIVKENNLPIPQFIKIDTQGSELDILSGVSFLDQVDLICIECPILCYNRNAPTIQDYINFFKLKNYVPIDISEIHRMEDILVQIDIMFMRHDSKEKYIRPTKNIRPFS
jgi:FkbM family methyltransferase